ncbi:hypothetical protein [Shewanella surugensis]|uniref:Uncharacterized protein n=1 Tax=Shewanella surugensis TaxID=212020 RepID=A0ABT0LHR5_9GAMM|nr:hypothetical protein [Shewanella surugensis]MCL1127233.1 hypothetical protein [Shewanella surugensis]
MYPLYYYFQDISYDHDFRFIKKHIDALKKFILSNQSVELYTKYEIDLRPVFYEILEKTPDLPKKFHEKEMVAIIDKVNDKFDRRYLARQKYLQIKTEKSDKETKE